MRVRIVFFAFLLSFSVIIARLFYWQILERDVFAARARAQHWIGETLLGRRGAILAKDGYPLARGASAADLFADKMTLSMDYGELTRWLTPILRTARETSKSATPSAATSPGDTELQEMQEELLSLLEAPDRLWVKVAEKLSATAREAIEREDIPGLVFLPAEERIYPEATMAAHVLGFVGGNARGEDQGYYGIEGRYNGELKGRHGYLQHERDAAGRPILIGRERIDFPEDGRDLRLTIERAVQFMAEGHLDDALSRYGAASGSIVIMDPATGAIRAMASRPSYDPSVWQEYDEALYRNPVIAETYEPGSTFKVLVMAAALNEGVVKPDTRCSACSGPREIGGFTIRTWNDVYHPDATMREILQYSDNVGMVEVGERLGIKKLWQYLTQFGVLATTGIDLQEEESSSVRPLEEWRSIDLATASFGQGVAITAIQMLAAVGAIANDGVLIQPHVVAAIEGTDRVIEMTPKKVHRVITRETAATMTLLMENAVERGEATWARLEGYRIAGKTGTASIPIQGHYDREKTIASFVGFAPSEDPTFVMLVTLREPSSSPWAAETTAPLFFDIARDLLRYDGVPPAN